MFINIGLSEGRLLSGIIRVYQGISRVYCSDKKSEKIYLHEECQEKVDANHTKKCQLECYRCFGERLHLSMEEQNIRCHLIDVLTETEVIT